MSARLLKGREVARRLVCELMASVQERGAAAGESPRLHIFLLGEDAAAAQYLRALQQVASRVGVATVLHPLPASLSFSEYRRAVVEAGADPAVKALQVLKPVPGGHQVSELMEGVPPEKDVEGVHPENLGLLLLGRPRYVPCTAAAVMRLLAQYGIPLSGKRAVVVGRSDSVGKPLAGLLLARHATVTVCHSATANLAEEVQRAEVLVVAMGRPEAVQTAWIRPGSVVVDLGHHVLPDGRTVGDVEAGARERAGHLSPVRGGVGPLTVALLMGNTLQAYNLKR